MPFHHITQLNTLLLKQPLKLFGQVMCTDRILSFFNSFLAEILRFLTVQLFRPCVTTFSRYNFQRLIRWWTMSMTELFPLYYLLNIFASLCQYWCVKVFILIQQQLQRLLFCFIHDSIQKISGWFPLIIRWLKCLF